MIRKLLLLCSLLLLPLSGWADSPETIRIGTTQSLSGHFEEFGTEQLKGLQMWVSDVNSRGALLGRPVELVYHDDRSRSAGAADGFTRLIEKDGVDLLVGPYSSALTLASSVVAEAHGIPMVATAASAEEIWSRGLDNVFGIDTPANNYLTGINIARNNGARTAAILYKDTEFTTEVAAGVRRNAADGDINLLLDESYPPPQRNFDDLAQRLKSLDPDVIVGLSYLEDSIAIVQALKKAGVKPRMLIFTVGPALREFGDALGEDAEGITGVVQWLRSVPKPGAQ
ncbi:MAG: amino acid ABC transporter substrate-binding protein, partial [Halioglobus sp.]